MKPIATDTYNFERLITDGYTYVDKTEVLYPLINKTIGSQFFLSRPRRFGKSLLVSTFKSLFQGRRDLFKGFAIDSLEYDWKVYPVLHLDMGSMQAPTIAEFEEKLLNQLMSLSKELDVEVEKSSIPSIVFTRLCEALAAKSPHIEFVNNVDANEFVVIIKYESVLDQKKTGVNTPLEGVNTPRNAANIPCDEGLLTLIRKNPGQRIPFFVELTGRTKKSIEHEIATLKSARQIEFRGAPKTGGYYLIYDSCDED